jgi:hypothetical protein
VRLPPAQAVLLLGHRDDLAALGLEEILTRPRLVPLVPAAGVGRYHSPEATAAGVEPTGTRFAMILDGIALSRVRRLERFSVPIG